MADVAVLKLERGDFGFVDSFGARQRGTQKLNCEMTLRDGAIVYDLNGLSRPDWTTVPEKKGEEGQEVTWRHVFNVSESETPGWAISFPRSLDQARLSPAQFHLAQSFGAFWRGMRMSIIAIPRATLADLAKSEGKQGRRRKEFLTYRNQPARRLRDKNARRGRIGFDGLSSSRANRIMLFDPGPAGRTR